MKTEIVHNNLVREKTLNIYTSPHSTNFIEFKYYIPFATICEFLKYIKFVFSSEKAV